MLLSTLCVLATLVPFALPRPSLSEKPSNSLLQVKAKSEIVTRNSSNYDPNWKEKYPFIQYPWYPDHDKKPSRHGHPDWKTDTDLGYCAHTRPAFREPGTPFEDFMGDCARFLRRHDGGWPQYKACTGSKNPEAETYSIQAENPGGRWLTPCYEGCWTCLDAMEEYGAESLFCMRATQSASCKIWVTPQGYYESDEDPDIVYYAQDFNLKDDIYLPQPWEGTPPGLN